MAAQCCSVEIFSESQSSDLLVHHLQKVAKHYHYQANFPAAAPAWAAAAAGHHQSRRSYRHQAQTAAHHLQNHQPEWWLVEAELVAAVWVAEPAPYRCHEMERGEVAAEILVGTEAYLPACRGHMTAVAQAMVLVEAG